MKQSNLWSTILKHPLYDFQERAAKFGLVKRSSALFMEQGTGKTPVALAILSKRYEMGKVQNVLVLCPKSVISVWEEHSEKFLRCRFVFYSVADVLQRPEVAEHYRQRVDPRMKILVCNFEAARIHRKKLLKLPYDMVIVDESHKIKRYQNKTSKAAYKLRENVDYRMVLSGTPVTGEEYDIYGQYTFLNPQIFGDWKSFQTRYLGKRGYGRFTKVMRKARLPEFERIVHKHCFRITKAEALDLPPMVDQRLYCELDGHAAKAYRELETDLVTHIKEANLTATTPLTITKMLRLQQITGGHLVDDDGAVYKIGDHKIAVLRDFLEGWKKKFVVFCRFRDEIEDILRLCKALDISAVPYHGGTKDRSVWKVFQKKRDPQAFVAQIGTGGIGIDLYAADTAIFYSTTFSYTEYDQARSRLHRNGQRNHVTNIHVVAKNSIDIYIAKALQRKFNVAKTLLDAYRNRR